MKYLYWIGGSVVGLVILVNLFGGTNSTTVSPQQVTAPAVQSPAPVQPLPEVAPTPAPAQTGLSNDNYYTNSDGNTVHSPAYSNSAPAGATAICRDGTYSFSQHRSGTCSHHGGVDIWL